MLEVLQQPRDTVDGVQSGEEGLGKLTELVRPVRVGMVDDFIAVAFIHFS